MFTSMICAHEFSVHGTCCDPWSLPYLAKNDQVLTDYQVNVLNRSYKMFNGFLHKAGQKLMEQAFLPQSSLNTDYLKNLVAKTKTVIELPAIKEIIRLSKTYN